MLATKECAPVGTEPTHPRLHPRIPDKIKHHQSVSDQPFFSFEYFPPKTPAATENLYDRVSRMVRAEPLFCDVTWGAGGSTSELTLEISGTIQKFLGVDVMMHLTCTNMPAGQVDVGLNEAKKRGIRNLLALRGDPPVGKEWTACEDGFECARDLVAYIRKNHGDYFGIGIAGYPEGHPAGFLDGKCTMDEEMAYLKSKVDAGADFIVTQMFFDVDIFLDFVKKCREIGINVPILPGILPIQNYSGFKRMITFCKTQVPQDILDKMEMLQNDDSAAKDYGIQVAVDMCKKILKAKVVPGIHFYTLNLEKSVMTIIDKLGMLNNPNLDATRKTLPWRPSTADNRRGKEQVRPIYWANRPLSYLSKTSEWDEFPNGRWGDIASPAFGPLSDHHLGKTRVFKAESIAEKYGTPTTVADIAEVFEKFLTGACNILPWLEGEADLAKETNVILPNLCTLAKSGILTINSQPRVNGAPSSDPIFGWGAADGFVYQKAYLEFFASPQFVDSLFTLLQKNPDLFNSLTVYEITKDRNEIRSNKNDILKTNAVTWGVFPASEIVQPTVVDPNAFLQWKQEAFELWMDAWGNYYPEDSPSRKLLQEVQSTYSLVTIVDNDFISGDIFKIFFKYLLH